VPVVGHREPGRLGGPGFFLLEEVGLVGVGQVRRHHLHQSAAEDPQGSSIVIGGLGDQVSFGLDDQVGVQVVGQVLDRADDHLGQLEPEVAVRQRVPDQVVSGQVVPQPDGAGRGRAGLLGVVGEPVRRTGGADP
jgi:hypothetical protein